MKVQNKIARWLLVAAAALLTLQCGRSSDFGRRLNVLVVTLDTTRADRLGCYGYSRGTSPRLDALAEEAVVFDLAIAQAAVTPVSHASIFTGLDPNHHGLRVLHGTQDNRLGEEQETLAEIWRELGGQTAAFVSAFPVTGAFGLDQGFDHFDDRFPGADGRGLVAADGTVDVGSSQRRADATTRAAIEWLDNEADADRPLFMWVHYFDPHDLEVLPPEDVLLKFAAPTRNRPDIIRAVYDAEVAFMDSAVGDLLDAFRGKGLWESTIVIVVADHGEGLGDHGWWTHGILYQEQIRVPLIVRVPGVGGPGRVADLVRTTDLVPTVLDALGVPDSRRPETDGRSLIATLDGAGSGDPIEAYADSVNMLEYGRPDVAAVRDRKDDKLYCLMNERHKLIYHQLRPENSEFYDLVADPGERNNLAGSQPPEMRALLERLHALEPFSDILPDETPTDPERLERLKSLGYVQ